MAISSVQPGTCPQAVLGSSRLASLLGVLKAAKLFGGVGQSWGPSEGLEAKTSPPSSSFPGQSLQVVGAEGSVQALGTPAGRGSGGLSLQLQWDCGRREGAPWAGTFAPRLRGCYEQSC